MHVIAHRGASGEAPENTIAAFELAWEQGADAIECDLRLTADREIVALHDATLDRTTGVAECLRDLTFAELRRRAPSVPTLDEILAAVPSGKFAVLELKEDLVSHLPARLRDLPVTFIAFDHAIITAAKARFPARPALWLLNRLPVDLPSRIEHLDGIDLRYAPNLTQSKIGNQKSKISYAFTVNDPTQIAHCQALGFDAITTDFPARTKSLC